MREFTRAQLAYKPYRFIWRGPFWCDRARLRNILTNLHALRSRAGRLAAVENTHLSHAPHATCTAAAAAAHGKT